MPNDAIACMEENLKTLMDKYVEFYHECESLPEFESLIRSVRGSGMFFQYSQSTRDAIVARANESRKKLKHVIFEKAQQENHELVDNLLSQVNDARMYLATKQNREKRESIRSMIYSLTTTYLPE